MSPQSQRTSFFSLTSNPESSIASIEIPQFQRDYAQGRETDNVTRIRNDFLDVIHSALDGDDGADVGLDFVYGAVDGAIFQPLDGQQRLTTLFLLHWYIASRSGHLAGAQPWKRFSYSTRLSARMFCERLSEAPLPLDIEGPPSGWIRDRPWYLFLWRQDPTIRSMLVMIDAIHERFKDVDAIAAWSKLTDATAPAVWFLLLPLSGLSSSGEKDMKPEDLYIKMNSRGKPLTEFENFKAQFEKTIQSSPRANEFAEKVDTSWSDLLWHLRGEDNLIDDEFLKYMEFITEVCEWLDGRDDGANERMVPRTRTTFGVQNAQHEGHLDFLFDAFDVWTKHRSDDTFQSVFSSSSDLDAAAAKVRLFFRSADNQDDPLDLFEVCCRRYGEKRGRARLFSLGQSLILYAVVLHLVEQTSDFLRRVRVLRNLIEASSDELREDRMPKILEDVHSIVRHGAIEMVASLNQAQVEDEKLKAAFLAANPGLEQVVHALEDHELLRGSLGAFELEAPTFADRATAFHRVMSQPELWTDLVGALLAVGEYQRRRTRARPFLFGTDSKRHDSAWRELLTGPTRDALQQTRKVLAELLDRVACAHSDLPETLTSIVDEYLASCEKERVFDWRYYMVKYPAMRESGSSTYFAEPTVVGELATMGYSLCMLRAGAERLSSKYRDPYLLAISRELEDGLVEDKWFDGYEDAPRRLPLKRSQASIRCVNFGFELSPPATVADMQSFESACAKIGAVPDTTDPDATYLAVVPQQDIDGRPVDMVDRIQFGVDIVRRLAAAGL